MLQRLLPMTILLAAMAAPSAWASGEKVSFRAVQWLPVTGRSGTRTEGYLIDLVRAILEPKGFEVEYRMMPWERAQRAVSQGNIDCVLGPTEAIPNVKQTSFTFGQTRTGFYVRQELEWTYQGPESLANLRLGVIGGYRYGEPIDGYIAQNEGTEKIVVVDETLDPVLALFMQLMNGSIDVIAEDPLIMNHALDRMNIKNRVKNVGQLQVAQSIRIGCSTSSERAVRVLALLDQGVQELVRTGGIKPVMARYGLSSGMVQPGS